MFHLHAGVHFNEIKLAVFVQELKGARTAVANFFTSRCATVADFFNQLARDARCRRFFDHFLVTALHRAIALAQVHRVLVLVSQDLNFDVTRVLQKLFHVHRRVAKRGAGLGLGHLHRIDQCSFGVHHAHAASTTTASGFDDDGVTHALGDPANLRGVVGQLAFRAGHARHTGFDHGLLGRHFVAHDADGISGGPNKLEAAFFNPLGKVSVFAQEAIARVNGFGIGHFGSRNDGGHVEVALR